jgi:hypothetical protein
MEKFTAGGEGSIEKNFPEIDCDAEMSRRIQTKNGNPNSKEEHSHRYRGCTYRPFNSIHFIVVRSNRDHDRTVGFSARVKICWIPKHHAS